MSQWIARGFTIELLQTTFEANAAERATRLARPVEMLGSWEWVASGNRQHVRHGTVPVGGITYFEAKVEPFFNLRIQSIQFDARHFRTHWWVGCKFSLRRPISSGVSIFDNCIWPNWLV